jgi:two-component system, NarL family, response regulator DevR
VIGDQVRVLLVDDHEMVRRGVRAVLEEDRSLVVVGEAGTVISAVVAARESSPDVVLMDLRLPDGSGVEACRQILSEQPDCRVAILTSHADEDAVFAALIAGAAGYILKDLDATKLRDGVLTIARGGLLIDPMLTSAVIQHLRASGLRHPADSIVADLSATELRLATLIADGLSNREIADVLVLAEKTTKNYVSILLAKLGLRHRAEVARIVTEYQVRREEH